MYILQEESLKDFEFWSGAKAVAELDTEEEMERIENFMNQCSMYWTPTEINDFFRFDDETIAEILGYEDFEQMYRERRG